MLKFSVIIPVYNRPEELDELLESLTRQSKAPYEVLVIDDGSVCDSKEVSKKYEETLNLRYFSKINTGQGYTRNFGFDHASGDYFVVFDSDCIIPEDYFEVVDQHLKKNPLDAYGGPDAAHKSFTLVQKAISYSMTSLFTTGGIRGRKKHAGTFHPRSFNMGISRKVYEATHGYRLTRMGEDIEFSIRIIDQGFSTGLIQEAKVYHKRRTDLISFWKQLHFFGRARFNINRFFPGELKLFHLFPLFFFLGLLSIPVLGLLSIDLMSILVTLYGFYFMLIFLDASIKNGPVVGLLSLFTSLIQLCAYATGLIRESFR